ncbi:hypothetical protein LTR16_008187, partial [Cryomyces antarcticus]
WISEEYLWHTLTDASIALTYCQYGLLDGRRPFEEWNEVFHRDVKPSNIFLSSSNTRSAHYPRVDLGDFGCAIFSIGVGHEPSDGLEVSHADVLWQPPESPRFPPRSDVYQLGMVMQYLVNCTTVLSPRRRDVEPAYSPSFQRTSMGMTEREVSDRLHSYEIV